MAYSVIIAMTILTLIACSVVGTEIEMPSDCEGKAYCTTIPEDYSLEEMDHAVKISKYWLGIGAQLGHYENMEPVYNVSDGNNCGSVTKVEKPYIIKTVVDETNTKNKRVVQSNFFKQTIKTTSCFNREMPCFEELKAVQNNIETQCDESNSTITIYVFEDGRIQPQPFSIPVSCTCKVNFKQVN